MWIQQMDKAIAASAIAQTYIHTYNETFCLCVKYYASVEGPGLRQPAAALLGAARCLSRTSCRPPAGWLMKAAAGCRSQRCCAPKHIRLK